MAKLSDMITPLSYETPGSPAVKGYDPDAKDDDAPAPACATCQKPLAGDSSSAPDKTSNPLSSPIKGTREMAPIEQDLTMSMLSDMMGSDPKPDASPSQSPGSSCATCSKPMPSTTPTQQPSEAAKKFAEKFRNLKPRMSNDGN